MPSRFTHEDFLDFIDKAQDTLTETSVAFSIIAGSANIPSQQNLLFGNFTTLTDGSITKDKPDFYDGSRPSEINAQIREQLASFIMPSTNSAAPCLPNFFAELKGPQGTPDVCENQALYDGALGARGMHKLESYVDPGTAYDGIAYTIISTYEHGGWLAMYTMHASPSKDPKIPAEYRMTRLRSFAMLDSVETFRQGATALWNAREWAKEKREELIAAANRVCSSTQRFVSQPSNETVQPDSESSADELL